MQDHSKPKNVRLSQTRDRSTTRSSTFTHTVVVYTSDIPSAQRTETSMYAEDTVPYICKIKKSQSYHHKPTEKYRANGN